MSLTYAIVSPVRDEERHLARVASCLAGQVVPPIAWCVVDNGSEDRTLEVARSLAAELPWIRVATAPPGPRQARGAAVVRAFHAGLAAIGTDADVVVKLDADVSFSETYFERLLAAFEADPSLGIASGTCFDWIAGGWQQRYGTGGNVWGAARAYRRACLDAILPLEERMGWDAVDVVKAATNGWRTATLVDLPFHHHRPEGARDGSRRRVWAAQGELSHYLGYRASYVLLRTIHRARTDRAAWALLGAYLRSTVKSEPRCADREIRSFLRRQQSLRRVPQRIREAHGRLG